MVGGIVNVDSVPCTRSRSLQPYQIWMYIFVLSSGGWIMECYVVLCLIFLLLLMGKGRYYYMRLCVQIITDYHIYPRNSDTLNIYVPLRRGGYMVFVVDPFGIGITLS